MDDPPRSMLQQTLQDEIEVILWRIERIRFAALMDDLIHHKKLNRVQADCLSDEHRRGLLTLKEASQIANCQQVWQ